MNFAVKGTENFVFATSAGTAAQFLVAHTASAVNYLQVNGAATGNEVTIRFTGSDTNVGGLYAAKGTGSHRFFTNDNNQQQFNIAHTASAVNYLQVTGAATGGNPSFQAVGSDTNIGFNFSSKGSSSNLFYTNALSNLQFVVGHTASAVNYLQANGGATGNAVTMSAQGSDTNIDLNLTPKGTGVLRYGTHTAGVVAQAGYITIKDAGGTTRRLLVG
jgi:hypothetical protein